MNSPGVIPHSEFRIGGGARVIVRVPHSSHKRSREGGPAHATPWGGRDPLLHAGGDAGHGASALPQRPPRRRRIAGARQHLPPARAAGRGRGGPARRPAPLHGLGPAAAHRLGRIPGVLARGVADGQRRRRRVSEPRGRVAPLPDAGARRGDPVDPRRRRRDGIRPCGAGGGGSLHGTGRPRTNVEVVGAVCPPTCGAVGRSDRRTVRRRAPNGHTVRQSDRPTNLMAHLAGRGP